MPFGQASRKALSEKVLGKQVEVMVKTKDRYGRTVGHVFLDSCLFYLAAYDQPSCRDQTSSAVN